MLFIDQFQPIYHVTITGCRIPFTIQVKFTDGYDGPDTQLVLNVSPNATIRLLSGDGIPYTVMTGSESGRSATSKLAP